MYFSCGQKIFFTFSYVRVFFLAKLITDKYNISITRIEGDLLAKIIDFNEAKKKNERAVLNELHELYDNLTTMNMDAAFLYQFNLPAEIRKMRKKNWIS